jgi:osmotically-inducible protein OsmY
MLVCASGLPAAGADRTGSDTMARVRRALERLPYYGVYDFLAFGIANGVVTLKGYAHRPSLKREAEEMVRHAVNADIVNRIEVLPTSSFDDRIRWAAYQQVYTDEIADRYVSGGSMETRYARLDMARFPGMEPFGTYPVHIIVKDRRVALIGVVINETDKAQILVRARLVPHALGVEDAIMVRAR